MTVNHKLDTDYLKVNLIDIANAISKHYTDKREKESVKEDAIPNEWRFRIKTKYGTDIIIPESVVGVGFVAACIAISGFLVVKALDAIY